MRLVIMVISHFMKEEYVLFNDKFNTFYCGYMASDIW